MANNRLVIGLGLAFTTLAVCIINATGNIAVLFKVGPTPILSLVAMALAAGVFAISWTQRSALVAAVLAISGIFFMVPALSAMGYAFALVTFPGPILGVIFGLVISCLGVTMALTSRHKIKAIPR